MDHYEAKRPNLLKNSGPAFDEYQRKITDSPSAVQAMPPNADGQPNFQQIANHSPQVSQLKAIQQMANVPFRPIQLKAHQHDCNCETCQPLQQKSAIPTLQRSSHDNGCSCPQCSSQLQRKTAQPIQRTKWTYHAQANNWTDETDTVGVPANLPVRAFQEGDIFDDVNQNVYSSDNARFLGQPNRFKGYQDLSPEHEAGMRRGLSKAKMKLTQAIGVLTTDEAAVRGGDERASGAVMNAMEMAFNVPGTTARTEILRLIEDYKSGLQTLLNGLNQDDLPMIAATEMVVYGIKKNADDCTGWVPKGFTELGGRGDSAHSVDDLSSSSGNIHLHSNYLGDPNFVADTIIHEATHKFLGTWDYSYVGATGAVERGVDQRAQQKQQANGALTADQAKAAVKEDMKRKAYASLVVRIIHEGINDVLPMGPTRNAPQAQGDSRAVFDSKAAWQIVKGWQVPNAALPDMTELNNRVTQLLTLPNLPSKAQKGLRKFQTADKESYLAEYGNDMGVKGHEVFFALSTDFLRKNADSWTEFAVKLGN